MVDFKELLGKKELTLETEPISIFSDLDKESDKGFIRPPQEKILERWYNNFRDQKDTIVKLPTGQGKTLIGLLMLQSFLNENEGPVVYICPNNYLVNQTIQQAESFGIKTVEFEENNTRIPLSFLNSEAILVTTCKRLFNGKSVFGVEGTSDYRHIGAIVIDDAHKCLEIIRESFSIRINKFKSNVENPIYNDFWKIFSPSLFKQGRGTCLDISAGRNCSLAVPFWVWQENESAVLDILDQYRDDRDILFTWDLIKDNLDKCLCIFSGKRIEISPRMTPTDLIPSYKNADRRIFMSATLTEDAFLVKDLGIESESVLNPLTFKNLKYNGERLILVPTLVNTALSRDRLINWICGLAKKSGTFGVVSIVPSKYYASIWKQFGSILTSVRNLHENITSMKEDIKSGKSNRVLVLLNEYDGIDLPDNTCRILILDSLPAYHSLMDEYTQLIRSNSKVIKRQLAQRIEQGMGRAIRSSSDWCAVIVIGNDITDFISEKSKRIFLSEEAQLQIELAEYLANQIKSEGAHIDNIEKLLYQCIKRDAGWKEYYKEWMAKLKSKTKSNEYLEIAILERDAEILYQKGQIKNSIDKVQELISKSEDEDKGWYLQLKATYLYKINKTESMDVQLKAFNINSNLSKPDVGIKYSKQDSRGKGRSLRILDWISENESTNSMIIKLSSILDKLSFSMDSDRFEEGIRELGIAIGFLSDRPEKKTSIGPDNLWNIYANTYWIIECKNEVKSERGIISKSEMGQMHNSIDWFKEEFEGYHGLPVFFHLTNLLAKEAYMYEAFWVISPQLLEKLKGNVEGFYRSLDLNNLSEKIIMEKLNEFNLDDQSFQREYLIRGKKQN